MKPAQQTYATNVRALSFPECLRFTDGFASGVFTYLVSRFVKPQGRMTLPINYDELDATHADLSENFRELVLLRQEPLAALGFRLLAYQRIRKSDDPSFIDSGSAIMLHANNRLVAVIGLMINEDPTKDGAIRITDALGMNFYTDTGHCNDVNTMRQSLDPRPGCKSVADPSLTPAQVFERISLELQKETRGVRTLNGWADVRAAMEAEDLENFLHRRDVRRLYVPVA